MMIDLRGADWPSAVDVMTAGQHIERAIHATTLSAFASALQAADVQLTHAAAYYGLLGDHERAAQVVAVQDQLAAMAAAAPSLGLAAAQQQLYAFQVSAVGRLWLQAEPGIPLWQLAVLSTAGSLAAIGIGWSVDAIWRRWERRHGR